MMPGDSDKLLGGVGRAIFSVSPDEFVLSEWIIPVSSGAVLLIFTDTFSSGIAPLAVDAFTKRYPVPILSVMFSCILKKSPFDLSIYKEYMQNVLDLVNLACLGYFFEWRSAISAVSAPRMTIVNAIIICSRLDKYKCERTFGGRCEAESRTLKRAKR